ncbi:HSP20-like chaperones superfamily protein [Actinidia rufa]|uniref:HSP20-like chaperones superfamily protein n=1 Tax=Actinidia rufa TaxID=165716 RepID=A0A7J0GR27_9ERIC|nr:HSP20-like chaperones superfamily protein [Actinidia rufa]
MYQKLRRPRRPETSSAPDEAASSIPSLQTFGTPSGTSNSHNFPRKNSAIANARVDWKETQEAHVFKADLPGLRKEEVKVEIEDDRVLQISGKRNVEKEDKSDTWHRMERSTGEFIRRFRLPENAKVDGVRASMENGVLTVTVPKEEMKQPEVKAIEISG